jgi:hypothetical protein
MRRREFIAVLNPRVLAVGLAAFAFFWNVRFRHRHRSTAPIHVVRVVLLVAALSLINRSASRPQRDHA